MYNIYTAKIEDEDNIELTVVGKLADITEARHFVEAHTIEPLYKGYSDEEQGDHGKMIEVQTGEHDYYLATASDEKNLIEWIASKF